MRIGLGALAADLVVEQTVSLLGVPSILEDDARDALAALIHAPIKDTIDATASDQWLQSDPFMRSLISMSADIQIDSTIELQAGPEVNGREEIRSLSVEHDGQKYSAGSAVVPVAASWEGTSTLGPQPVLTIEEHEFALRYGEIIRWMVDEVLGSRS